jgi:hypothetical protein
MSCWVVAWLITGEAHNMAANTKEIEHFILIPFKYNKLTSKKHSVLMDSTRRFSHGLAMDWLGYGLV